MYACVFSISRNEYGSLIFIGALEYPGPLIYTSTFLHE
jgi:hypothetical protein